MGKFKVAALLSLAFLLGVLPIASGRVSLKDDRKDGKPVALLPTQWTDEADNAEVPWNEYPRPQMVRPDWLNLNGAWDYIGGKDKPDPVAAGDAPPAFGDKVEKIKVPFPAESYLSGIMRKQEINLWYRRTFSIPEKWAGKHVLIHFGGVIAKSVVYVNGKLVGRHVGSWDAFEFDITSLLHSGSNEVIVGAWDNHDGHLSCGKNCVSQGDYTLSSGIWQTVWLEPVAATSIQRLVIQPNVMKSTVRIKAVPSSPAGRVDVVVRHGDDEIAKGSGLAGQEIKVSMQIAHKWSPQDPFLYDLTVRLHDAAGTVTDEVTSYFGMRSVELGTVKGQLRPMLNGKFEFMFGPLDQGYWPDGVYTAPTETALKFDLDVIKKLGFNLVRKHAKLEPQRWYYDCDKLGLMVWQDMPSFWYPEINQAETRAEFEREWQIIIEQHSNSPSIVGWVPFNENWGAYDVPRITDWSKQLDPTRLVNGNTGYNNAPGYRKAPGDPKNGDFDDLHIYVGPGKPSMPSATRAACLGEFGGVGLQVADHMWPVRTGAYQMFKTTDALTERYEGLQVNLARLVKDRGLGAAIYTQTTDVEHEINGFLTFDRKVEKMDFAKVKAANDLVFKAVDEVNGGN